MNSGSNDNHGKRILPHSAANSTTLQTKPVPQTVQTSNPAGVSPQYPLFNGGAPNLTTEHGLVTPSANPNPGVQPIDPMLSYDESSEKHDEGQPELLSKLTPHEEETGGQAQEISKQSDKGIESPVNTTQNDEDGEIGDYDSGADLEKELDERFGNTNSKGTDTGTGKNETKPKEGKKETAKKPNTPPKPPLPQRIKLFIKESPQNTAALAKYVIVKTTYVTDKIMSLLKKISGKIPDPANAFIFVKFFEDLEKRDAEFNQSVAKIQKGFPKPPDVFKRSDDGRETPKNQRGTKGIFESASGNNQPDKNRQGGENPENPEAKRNLENPENPEAKDENSKAKHDLDKKTPKNPNTPNTGLDDGIFAKAANMSSSGDFAGKIEGGKNKGGISQSA